MPVDPPFIRPTTGKLPPGGFQRTTTRCAHRYIGRVERAPAAPPADGTVYTSMTKLIERAKANEASLAVFKPSVIIDFVWEKEEREWDIQKVLAMREQTKQYELFEDNAWRQLFRIIPKLPYSFSYKFQDSEGRTCELQVLDWETGALYWNCLRSTGGDEEPALAKVREKYLDSFRKTDLHFFLGTTQQFHFIAPNPWVIVGVFPIPQERQTNLFQSAGADVPVNRRCVGCATGRGA